MPAPILDRNSANSWVTSVGKSRYWRTAKCSKRTERHRVSKLAPHHRDSVSRVTRSMSRSNFCDRKRSLSR